MHIKLALDLFGIIFVSFGEKSCVPNDVPNTMHLYYTICTLPFILQHFHIFFFFLLIKCVIQAFALSFRNFQCEHITQIIHTKMA